MIDLDAIRKRDWQLGGLPRTVAYYCAGKYSIPAYVMLVAEHLGCCPMTDAERDERLGWTHEQMAKED